MTSNTRGILWGLAAAALLSVAIALAKLAVPHYHVLQILFFRQMMVFASSLPSVARSFPQSLKTRQPGVHLMRMIGAFAGLSCGIWAVAVLPLTTAITLAFAQVFFIALLALWFLREPVGPHRLGAVVVGFVGVLVVMRPGVEGLIDIYALIPLLGALGGAVAMITVRRLSQTESTATLLVYQSLFIGTMSGVPLFWFWKTPDFDGLMLLLGMGFLATCGQWTAIRALRYGEASVIGNMEYTKLIYATILGYILFREIPDGYTLIGAGIIIAASLYIYRREARLKSPPLIADP